eukprot:2364590-Lingulodinium_polyedra.AAC.1
MPMATRATLRQRSPPRSSSTSSRFRARGSSWSGGGACVAGSRRFVGDGVHNLRVFICQAPQRA